jgi:multicomponent Na+:H+ antiporter subunit D
VSTGGLLPLPILAPLAGAILAGFLPQRVAAWCSLLTTLLTLGAGAFILLGVLAEGPVSYAVGGWPAPYGIVLVGDLLGAIMVCISAVVATAAALFTLLARAALREQRMYHPLFLLVVMALGGVFLTGDLFTLYVFMELAIISTLPLVGMAKRSVSAEASFKYAVLSALGSAVLLVCVALVYSATGTLNMADIAARPVDGAGPVLMEIAAALLVFVFLLKAAVFPFHFWQPDAHSAAPAPVSAMLSGILVKVGIYGLIRLQSLLIPDATVLRALAPVGAVAVLFGGLAALANRDLKRMLAYSTISNVGFIVLALGWGGVGMVAALVNTVTHALIKAALFLSGGFVAERVEEHEMSRLGGVAVLSPIAATVFGLAALGIAGIPPLGGFVGKLTLLGAAGSAGDLPGLSVVIIGGALGIAYPLRAFLQVFWGGPEQTIVDAWGGSSARSASLLAPLLLVLLVLLIGLWPGPLFALLTATADQLADADAYITAALGRRP